MPKRYYITTTLPYINAEPHIGFAREIVQADVLARWHRLIGDEVLFNTGTDEHGLKVYRKATELGKEVKAYCDERVQSWQALKGQLNLSIDKFVRTTDEQHARAAQTFWRIARNNGFITKKKYKVKYCVGCELEKQDSELTDGRCPLHPSQPLEIIEEENYFFQFSKFQKKLLDLYKKNPQFVQPENRLKEIQNFVSAGLEDFSISRLKEKMPWGIEVPEDPNQVMYVWFDALVNYISILGWPEDLKEFKRWWPAVQVAGKDNLRQQSAMWQAMLMAVGLPPSKQILINGFIVSGGQKMSKSLGNVIAPETLVNDFGVDGTRYLLLGAGDFSEDIDITPERLLEKYNADLANGLGNLVSRVLAMAEKYCAGQVPNKKFKADLDFKKVWQAMSENYESYKLFDNLKEIWEIVKWADGYVDATKPWQMAKANKPEAIRQVIYNLLEVIRQLGWLIKPLMPETSEKILQCLGEADLTLSEAKKVGRLKAKQKIGKVESLFLRK